MASLDLRWLFVAFYATTIPALGQDFNGICAAPQTGSIAQCVDKVQVVLQVSLLNETVSAVPVQATRKQPAVIPARKPEQPPQGPTISPKSKFLLEKAHFRVQMEAARKLRRQFSTAPPHLSRDIEYYDSVLDEYEDYVAKKDETALDYCRDDGRISTEKSNLAQTDSGRVPRDYEVFPGVGVLRFHTQARKWEDARRQCEAEDARLLVVNSQEEANVTVQMFSRCRHLPDQQLNDFAYIGVRQVNVNGQYITIQGEKVDDAGYANWDFGHPDSTEAKNVKCVSINRAGYLIDLDCHHRLAYFCEYDGF